MNILNYIETNPLIIGITGLINSIGVRLIWEDFDITDRQWIYNSNFKKVVIFTIIFATTRNIFTSILLFLIYMILFQYDYINNLLHPNNEKQNVNNQLFN